MKFRGFLHTELPRLCRDVLQREAKLELELQHQSRGGAKFFIPVALQVYFLFSHLARPDPTTPTITRELARSQEIKVLEGRWQPLPPCITLTRYFFLKWQSPIPFLGLACFNLGRKCKSVRSAALQACWLSTSCLRQCLRSIPVISLG